MPSPTRYPSKPPLGVMPYYLWAEANPDPSLQELSERYGAVQGAVDRYRAAGFIPPILWLIELGVPVAFVVLHL